MPEKYDCCRHSHGGEIRYWGNPVAMGVFFAVDMKVCVDKRELTQRCAPLSPSSFVTFDFAGLSNLGYITSVFIGYIGTGLIGSLNKRFAAKKAGVEDGRNQ